MQQQLTKDSPAMTIRDLLIHCAGFPTDDPWADRKLDIQEEELIALLKKGITFSNATGTVFEYSNLGYAILGYIIKKITGMAYGKYINTQICQPIGMNEVFWEFTEIPNSQLAHGYRLIYEKWEEEKLFQDGAFGAMGGMITSVELFSRYIALHQFAWPARDDKELKVIKRSSMREMHQPWKFKKLEADFKYASGRVCAQTSAYGYGLNWLKDSLGRVFVGHSGGLPGFGSN